MIYIWHDSVKKKKEEERKKQSSHGSLFSFSYMVFGNDNTTFSWKINLSLSCGSKSMTINKQTSVDVRLGSSFSPTRVKTIILC